MVPAESEACIVLMRRTAPRFKLRTFRKIVKGFTAVHISYALPGSGVRPTAGLYNVKYTPRPLRQFNAQSRRFSTAQQRSAGDGRLGRGSR